MEVITLFFYSFLHHVPTEGNYFEQIFFTKYEILLLERWIFLMTFEFKLVGEVAHSRIIKCSTYLPKK
jgi:hypothetical protein